jgi:hypothetical protein
MESQIMSSTTQSTVVIRNYLIAAASVMFMSAGLSDIFNSPHRIAQQDRLDGYGQYISAGLVNYAKTLGR